jgi:hypothetical protein
MGLLIGASFPIDRSVELTLDTKDSTVFWPHNRQLPNESVVCFVQKS